MRVWNSNWTLVMKYRNKSAFSQCDVCQELKHQFLDRWPLKVLRVTFSQSWCKTQRYGGVYVIRHAFLWEDIKPGSRTGNWALRPAWTDSNYTANTSWTNLLTAVRSTAWEISQLMLCHAPSPAAQTVRTNAFCIKHVHFFFCVIQVAMLSLSCPQFPKKQILNRGEVHGATWSNAGDSLSERKAAKTTSKGPRNLDVWRKSEGQHPGGKPTIRFCYDLWTYCVGGGRCV